MINLLKWPSAKRQVKHDKVAPEARERALSVYWLACHTDTPLPMTPTRCRERLDFLGLSHRRLAPILQWSNRLTRSWARGHESILPDAADRLETWVAIRLAHPDQPLPPPPRWPPCVASG